jgi:GT2 family glycosyltransferase
LTCTSQTGAIGVVVPTLGSRPEYLLENLESLRRAGRCVVAVVRPPSASGIDDGLRERVDLFVDDPGNGLAAAINCGMTALPADVAFATWLGDDDLLTDDSLDIARDALVKSGAVAVFGQCQYIDGTGAPLWLNRSGRWAVPLMRFGPQLVPQPGSLFRRGAFDRVGRLNEELRWAFDLDLFLRLREVGPFTYVPKPLAQFRWHEGSLSVGARQGSVHEASRVRREAHRRPLARAVSVVTEPFVKWAIAFAGKRVTARAERIDRSRQPEV